MTRQWVTRHGRTFEVGTLNSAVPPAPTPKRRKHGPFTKIPIVWEEELGKAHASGSTYAVAIVLLYEAWRLKINGQKSVVKLTNEMLKRVRVGEDGKRAALRKLEELKLVGVEQQQGCNPLVTVYFVDQ